EPTSTTTTSWRRTLSRHVSTQGSASSVTTTTQTSAMADARPAQATEALPGEDRGSRERERERHEEEEEPGREGRVRVDVEVAEEVDEERLAHRKAVDRGRDRSGGRRQAA